jgi:hypothetical protein
MPSIRISVGFQSNTVSLKGSPWVPLVIHGGEGLDVRDVNVGSLKFGRTGHEVSLRGSRTLFRIYRDVDRDGKLDLVLFVDIRKTGLRVGDQSVSLTGATKHGTVISGTSSVKVSQGHKPSAGKCAPQKSVATLAAKKKK